MALVKQPVDISFASGLDLKTDPLRVQPGKFLALSNSVFDKQGRLTKRNGYAPLPSVTGTDFLTTFNGNLTSVGDTLQALSIGTNSWVNKGNILPMSLNTLPLIRSSTNQTQSDSVISSNGLVCTVYTDSVPVSGTPTSMYKYVVADSTTGQNIVKPTLIPASGGGAVTGSPRVFLLGSYFIIVFTNVISGTSHLDYIAISTTSPLNAPVPGEIASAYIAKTGLSWDGVVLGSVLYIGYNNTSGGQNLSFKTLNSNLILSAAKIYTSQICTIMSMTADVANNIIYAAYYDSAGSTGHVLAFDHNLGSVLSPTSIISTGAYVNITCTAINRVITVFIEKTNAYSYDSGVPTNFIQYITCTQAGTAGSLTTLARSVGLASKAFLVDGVSYMLSVYSSPYQPSYFLLNGMGQVVSKLAYSNGGGYRTTGLPSSLVNSDGVAQIAYLYKDLVEAANKAQGASQAGIYSQTGINLASFNFEVTQITTSEIGSNLNISGGIVTAYDGYSPVEQEFFLWPDSIEATPETSGGSMTDQTYFYQVTYEWADNQGNVFRSAPSVPVSAVVSGGSGSGSVQLNIPTLRLTYKLANPVKIVIYRWSTAQQNYFQTTSISNPILNDPTVDSIEFTDINSDGTIIGNNLLYTTGGVLEDISPPATDNIALFNDRLWLVDAEDRNLLWYSKQVIEATPVEMSDLLTLYVAPTTASEGSTGPMTAIAPMDDKLVIFKANALGYINGTGPDNTGANNNYSDFTIINSVVGCINQNSIVFIPTGLMFQSNKGIWLLGRDLSTSYIGAPVEDYTTTGIVQSALNIPASNQVRFTLDSGITLFYDYYFNQWGTFSNVPATSATIYQNLHTYVNSLGQVLQESPGIYLDNTNPVLMSFTTSWISLAGLQGYERFYHMLLLGQYISPFKLAVQFAYNYNSSLGQSTIVTPIAPTPNWGLDPLWGSSSPWGGGSKVFPARVFPEVQKCQSFQVTITEIYDPSFGIEAGAGLTLSGLNLIVGVKKGSRNSSAARSFG